MKCSATKPLSDFYKHPKMSDGRLGKCKECTKRDVKEHRAKNIDAIREYNRKRGLDPKRKAANRKNYRKRISTPEGRAAEWAKKRAYINSTKRAATTMVGNAVRDGKVVRPKLCEKCGADGKIHGHHEDYYKPLDVVWLCTACHGKRHREINEEIRSGVDWSDRGF